MRRSNIFKVGLALLFLIALDFTKLPSSNFFSDEINNYRHFPFFGVLSLLLLPAVTFLFSRVTKKRHAHYLITFFIIIIIGGISEYLQIKGPRDADVMDLLRDAAGGISFLGFNMLFDSRIRPFISKRKYKIKLVVIMAATISLIMALIPVMVSGAAYIYRSSAFPSLCSFESVFESYYVGTKNAELEKVPPPKEMRIDNLGRIGYLKCKVAPYPGLEIEEPYPDWTGYDRLSFLVYSRNKDSFILNVRIDDALYNGTYQDRFNYEFKVEPGSNMIQIPIEEIENGAVSRTLDIGRISVLSLFLLSPDNPISFYIGDIVLE